MTLLTVKTMPIFPCDRKALFDVYRAAWGSLTQSQVDGLDFLLSRMETDERLERPTWAAYMLATVQHECAATWQPITERGGRAYFDKYEPSTPIGRRLGNTQPGDGYRYRGRGYVQITGAQNYGRFGLKDDPEAALNPATAYEILSRGMTEGLFTGKKLGMYLTADRTDYRQARRIVNRLDRADLIAGYARLFERGLKPVIV